MHDLFLLVLTPRAGTLNHRFLCSPGAGLTDRAAALWVEAAKRRFADDESAAVGPDFVAVRQRGVAQAVTGRTGDEVLMLAYVDTARADVRAVVGRLAARQPALREVAASAEGSSGGMVIVCPELGRWLADDFGGSPRARRCVTVPVGRMRTVLGWAAAALAVLAAAALGFAIFRWGPGGGPAKPTVDFGRAGEQRGGETKGEGPGKAGGVVKSGQQMSDRSKELLSKLKGPRDEQDNKAEKELDRVAGDKWREASADLVGQLSKGVDPMALLRLNNYKGGKECAVFRLKPEERMEAADALKLRKNLSLWHNQLRALRKEGKKALKKVDIMELQDSKFAVLLAIKKLSIDKTAFQSLDNDVTYAPATPWLSQEDVGRAYVIKNIVTNDKYNKLADSSKLCQLDTGLSVLDDSKVSDEDRQALHLAVDNWKGSVSSEDWKHFSNKLTSLRESATKSNKP